MGGAATARIRRVEDAVLLAAAAEARHMRDLLQRLGLAAYGGNYESVRARLERLGALDARFLPQARRGPQRPIAMYGREELLAAVAGARSLAEILRRLGCASSTSGYRNLQERLRQEDIDAAALAGRAWRAGRQERSRTSLEQLLVVGRRVDGPHLKRRLLREGILDAACAACGIVDWCGRPAPLELDHINGDRRDNRLENLRLLCPNCHAQTPTYRGRNIGRVDLVGTYSAGLFERPDGGTGKTREA